MINFISFHRNLPKKKIKLSQKKVIIGQDRQALL